MNLGLPDKLAADFPNFTPVERPIINTSLIPNSNWISGFTSGDGHFNVNINSAPRNKVGYSVRLRFRITQHIRDIQLMEAIISYLGVGKIYKYASQPAVYLEVSDFKSISNIVIPFFKKYPIYGDKLHDFLDWCSIQNLISKGSHRTEEGFNVINNLRLGMNKGRVACSVKNKNNSI